MTSQRNPEVDRYEAEQVEAAAREAAAIGGRAGDEHLDPAERPLVEAGEGFAEGFELAEEDLVSAIEGGDPRCDPLKRAFTPELESDRVASGYGEADHESSSETAADW